MAPDLRKDGGRNLQGFSFGVGRAMPQEGAEFGGAGGTCGLGQRTDNEALRIARAHDFGRREGKAQLVLDVHADGGGDDVGVVGVDRRKEKLCTSVCLRVDLVESPLALQRIEHHPRDLRFAR